MSNLRGIILLHVVLIIYSMGGIFSKLASAQPFLSFRFCLYYGIVLVLLVFYAAAWQQAVKNIPLTTAYANKAVTVVWGMVWGVCIFHEPVTIGRIFGAILVITGVVIYAKADGRP